MPPITTNNSNRIDRKLHSHIKAKLFVLLLRFAFTCFYGSTLNKLDKNSKCSKYHGDIRFLFVTHLNDELTN